MKICACQFLSLFICRNKCIFASLPFKLLAIELVNLGLVIYSTILKIMQIQKIRWMKLNIVCPLLLLIIHEILKNIINEILDKWNTIISHFILPPHSPLHKSTIFTITFSCVTKQKRHKLYHHILIHTMYNNNCIK